MVAYIFEHVLNMEVTEHLRNDSTARAWLGSMVSRGLHPVVELSFMPAVLANCSWAVAPLDCHATSGLPCKNELPGAPRCEAGMAYQGVRLRRPRSQIAALYCRLPTLYQLH